MLTVLVSFFLQMLSYVGGEGVLVLHHRIVLEYSNLAGKPDAVISLDRDMRMLQNC